MFWLFGCEACGILVPQLTKEQTLIACIQRWSLNHWTTREVLNEIFMLLGQHRKTDAFELWHWRRLFRVPWTARRSTQSVLKETSPEYSLEGLMLKLKLWYFGYLMWRADSLEKTSVLGKIEGRRKRGQQRMRWMASPTWRTWVWVNSESGWWNREAWHAAVHGVAKSWTRLSDWTELNGKCLNNNTNPSHNLTNKNPVHFRSTYFYST